MIRVLFVCMGNICRSPTAHGVFQAMVDNAGLAQAIGVDSAGTHAYHVGEAPDPRSQQTAQGRGVDLSRQRARRVTASDFADFDYVLAMDRDNYRNLMAICPADHADRVQMFLSYLPDRSHQDVPDPYFGGGQGFDLVYDLVEQASAELLSHIRKKHLANPA